MDARRIVTARVEAEPGWGQLAALLEVANRTDAADKRRVDCLARSYLRIEEEAQNR